MATAEERFIALLQGGGSGSGTYQYEEPEEAEDPQVKALRERGFDDDFISDMLDYADYLRGTAGRKSNLDYYGYLNDKYYRDAEADARSVVELLGLDPRSEEGQEMGRALIEYSLSGNEQYQDNKTNLENEKERIKAEEQKKKNEQKRDQIFGAIAEGSRYANGAPSDAEISFWQNLFGGSGKRGKEEQQTPPSAQPTPLTFGGPSSVVPGAVGYYGSAPTTVPGAPGYTNAQSPIPGLSPEELDNLFVTAREVYSGSTNSGNTPGANTGPVNQPPVPDWVDAYKRYSKGT